MPSNPINYSTVAVTKALAAADAKLNAMLGIGTFMTAEDMFAFAESQLKQLDGEIRTHVAGISVAKEKAAVLQAISGGLRSVKGSTGAQQKAKVEELIAQAKKAGLTDIENKLTGMKQEIEANIKNYGAASGPDFLEGKAQEIDAVMTDLTSSTELTMIKIQGLMQQRSQVLQLASNVIAALNEPAKNAIGNLRGS